MQNVIINSLKFFQSLFLLKIVKSLLLSIMDTFFPSEIARLVLGYLKEDECLKSWQTFLEESSNLREYFTLFKTGKVYSTKVNGYSLLDILNEYCVLKFQVLKKDPKTESEIIETEFIKEDHNTESTKQTVDSVFKNHLSSSKNLKDDVSANLSPVVCELPNPSCGNKQVKQHCTDVAENVPSIKSKHCCGQQNAISVKNNVDNRNKTCKEDKTQCHRRNKINSKCSTTNEKVDPLNQNGMMKQTKKYSDRNISSHSLNSFIQSLSDKVNKIENSPFNLPNFVQPKCDSKDSNQSLSVLKPSSEGNAVSSAETVLIDDDNDDIEIVEEIKKTNKCFETLSSKAKTGCCNNNVSANQKVVDNIADENTLINEPQTEINILNNSNVNNEQTSDSKGIKTIQTDAYDQNKINVPESTSTASNKVCYFNSGTFMQPSTAVNEISFTYPQNYILPNYAPSNSFTNNAPVYVVLNPSGAQSAPVINGTILTMPSVPTNTIPCAQSPVVPTAFVNNSISAPVNSFSSSLPTTNTVSNVDEVLLPSSQAAQKIVLPVGTSITLKEKNSSKLTVDNKVLKKSPKTYSKESQSSKVSKRKTPSQKTSQNKKMKDSLPKVQSIPAVEAGTSFSFEHKDGHIKTSKVSNRKYSPHKLVQKREIKDSLLPKDQLIPTPVNRSTLSLIDYKGGHSNKDQSNKISSDSCLSNVETVKKRKRSKEKKDKKCKKRKTHDKSPPILKVKIVKPKTSQVQSAWEKQLFSQHDITGLNTNPIDISGKGNQEVNDSTESTSTSCTSQSKSNNSTLKKSDLHSVKENRVLKVMLSDIFVDIHNKIDSLHDQESYASSNLSSQVRCENQINDLEKTTVQNSENLISYSIFDEIVDLRYNNTSNLESNYNTNS